MNANDEIRMFKEAVVDCFNVLYQILPGRTEKTQFSKLR
jgi:hypothetical protein